MLPENNTRLVESGRFQVPLDGTQANEHIRKSTFTHATAYNVDRYPDRLNLSFAYGAGHPKEVVYYMLDNPDLLGRSNPTDMSTGTTANTHTNYLKIPNLELRFDKAVDIEYVEDTGHLDVSGSAVMYPGLKPNMGDVFLLPISDGNTGVMTITSIRRLSISQSSYHAITYKLRQVLTPEMRDHLESQVVAVSYFDRTKYFTDNYTLLKYESYIDLKSLTQLRLEMIEWYLSTYHDQVLGSIRHPSGFFDPYLVKFLHDKISLLDHPKRPVQLYPQLYDYDRSIWYLLTESKSKSMRRVESTWKLQKFTPHYFAAGVTSLIGNKVVRLGKLSINGIDRSLPYPDPVEWVQDTPYGTLSSSFFEDKVIDDPLELSLRESITKQGSHPNTILKECLDFSLDTPYRSFYRVPLMLHLVDEAIRNIRR